MINRTGYLLQIYFFVSGVLFLGLALFYGTNDLFLSSFIPPAERKAATLGFISATTGDTRVRPAGELLWLPAKTSDPVYEYDSVFTGLDGKMKISVGTSTTLQVSPDSLFKISRKDHMTTIQIFQGEILSQSKDNESIKIQTQGKSKVFNLSEVERKVSREDFAKGPISTPSSQDLSASLENEDEFFLGSHTSSAAQASEEHHAPSASSDSPLTPKSKGLGDETNRKVIWLLGLSYALFSLIAMRELSRQQKSL